MGQGQKYTNQFYTIFSFTALLGNFGGLSLAIMGALSFILGSHQEFNKKRSMLKRLYGEEDKNAERFNVIDDLCLDEKAGPKDKFRQKI